MRSAVRLAYFLLIRPQIAPRSLGDQRKSIELAKSLSKKEMPVSIQPWMNECQRPVSISPLGKKTVVFLHKLSIRKKAVGPVQGAEPILAREIHTRYNLHVENKWSIVQIQKKQ